MENISVRQDRNLQIILLVTLTAVMGVSLITPVLPKIADVLGIEKEKSILLITAFTLPGVIAAPFYGIMADRWGRKRVLAPLLMLFGIAGASCGLVRDFNLLLILRFLQGLGSAGLFTLNNTIIGDIYPQRTRLQAMGINASMISIGNGVYPALGGLMAKLHWSAPFYLPIFGVVVGILVLTLLKNPEPTVKQPLGKYLFWAYSEVIKWRILRLFILSLVTFILAFGPIVSFIPLWMDGKFSSSPSMIGLVLSTASLSAAVVASKLGWLNRHVRVGWIVALSFLIHAVTFWTIPHYPSALFLMVPALFYGAAQGMNIPSVQTLIVSSASFEYRGAFMAINSTIILLGITAGPVLASIASRIPGIGLVGLYKISAGIALLTAVVLFLRGANLHQMTRERP